MTKPSPNKREHANDPEWRSENEELYDGKCSGDGLVHTKQPERQYGEELKAADIGRGVGDGSAKTNNQHYHRSSQNAEFQAEGQHNEPDREYLASQHPGRQRNCTVETARHSDLIQPERQASHNR